MFAAKLIIPFNLTGGEMPVFFGWGHYFSVSGLENMQLPTE
jgi:hypothetical protein